MAADENRGYKFYREVLKSPKYILAPMVDASEYPFRELCRECRSRPARFAALIYPQTLTHRSHQADMVPSWRTLR